MPPKTGRQPEKSLKPALKERQRKTKVSPTDPESGFIHRTNKPRGSFTLITDTYAAPGNVHNNQPFIKRLTRQLERFALNPLAIGLDVGYFTAPVCYLTEQSGVVPIIGYRRPNKGSNVFQKKILSMISRRTAMCALRAKS